MDRALNPLLLGLTLVVLFLACLLGSTALPMERVLAALSGNGSVGDTLVVWQIRLPRALCGFAVGAALGASGAVLQGLLRNPLAEPGVLGVSACASLGAVIALYYGFAASWAYAMPLAAIVGALLATGLIAAATLYTQSVVTLILIGVGLSSFAGAAMSFMLNFAPSPFTLADMVNWMLGSVANRSFADLWLVAPFMMVGYLLVFRMRRGLSALTLGEEAAVGIGLNLTRLRLAVVLGAGLLAGAAVALAGAIGFVGIVAPHFVRPLVHHDPARTVLPAALLGGLLVLVADIVVRVLPSVTELKRGVVAALLGAPVFVWIAMRRRGSDG